MPAVTLTVARTVIVADDTAFVRDRFSLALRHSGHHAIAVHTGDDLLAQARAPDVHIDLVVLDLRLPPGRGLEMVQALKAVTTCTAPLVVFSGTIASADEVRALTRLGVAGYINEYTSPHHIVASLTPHLFPDNHNRRSSPRVTCAIPISYRFGNTIASGFTLNLSQNGVAIRTTSPLAPKTVLKVRFRVPGGHDDIEAEARVAWVDRLTGMGLEFTEIGPASRNALDTFVQGHFFSNRKA